jgi:hypothetical protein
MAAVAVVVTPSFACDPNHRQQVTTGQYSCDGQVHTVSLVCTDQQCVDNGMKVLGCGLTITKGYCDAWWSRYSQSHSHK